MKKVSVRRFLQSLFIYLPHPIRSTKCLHAIARSIYISFLYNVNKRKCCPVKSHVNIFRLARNFSR